MTTVPRPLVMRLGEVTEADVARVGRKAATLGTFLRAGFPVPDGVVLCTEAHKDHAGEAPDGAARIPEAVGREFVAAVRCFGPVPLAVRSSAVDEDQPGRSAAGQFATVLGVEGPEALMDAVRRCWASSRSDHVTAYFGPGVSGGPRLAVLVQPMVAAEAAGVAFSANPVTGDRGEVVVNAVRGLGDRLVAGAATPDQWLVRGEEAVCQDAPEGALGAAQARAVAELVRRVERFAGVPQDIEWAFAGGQLVLLQARPITALPEPIAVPAAPPPGFWQREGSHFPRPKSPMYRGFLPGINAAMRTSFEDFGFLVDTVEFREIGGWGYMRVVPLGDNDCAAPPAELLPTRISRCLAAMRADLPQQLIRRWHEEWLPEFRSRIAGLRDENLAALTDEGLAAHFTRTVALYEDGNAVHFQLNAAWIVSVGELAILCRGLLGWDDQRSFALVAGLSTASTEPARRLAALADLLRCGVSEADPPFAQALADYHHEFGCRALDLEVAEPTLAETPALTLGLIRDQIVRGFEPAAEVARLAQERAAALAEARRLLAGRTAVDGARFERVLARAAQAYPIREDNEFFTVSAPIALVRYAALEIGRRLAARRTVGRVEDIFFLELTEATAALHGEQGDWSALVARRRGERAWVEAHPGPRSYGYNPGPPPSFAALPTEARLAMEALMWCVERIMAPAHSQRAQAAAAALDGLAASPGRYTGPVRVIRRETEFAKLQPGDVLVCPITSPVWSVLFPAVGALVTDTGGTLSHPAIIAREYRVPAVVATGNATSLLRDGQVVTVDGSRGQVLLGAGHETEG
jgi:pyruvate,water dikinase